MKRPRRIAAIVAALVVVIVAVLAIVPLFFSGQVARRVQAEVNQRVNAHVAWRAAGLSFFRHFPNLSLSLSDLSVVGVGQFQGDTLAAVGRVRVVLGLGSVLGTVMRGSPLVIQGIEIDRPRLHLLALEDGTANWDIARPAAASAPATASRPLVVSLRNFAISNATVAFESRQSNVRATVAGYSQTLSGDLSQSRVVLHTRADADTVRVVFAGVPYLDGVRLGLTAGIDANFDTKSYTLQDTELRLNGLALAVAGSARAAGDQLGLDFTFKAPDTDFRSLLSLVPAIYAHDFARLQTSGTFAVNGWVKGDYGARAFPAFAVNATVNDATFKYPDLPLPARSIGLDLALTNPGGSPDRTVVKLSRFHLVLGANPIDAQMTLTTPVSDPDVDARVAGTLDLADVGRTIKLQGIDQLAGTVAANASVRTRMSYLKKQQYQSVAASGSVDITGLTVRGDALPQPLAIHQASLTLAPQHARLRSFAATIGSSDVQASGTLDNLLGFALHQGTLQGSATVHSKRFNLDEWKADTTRLQIIPVPANVDLTLNATVAELLYGKLTMTDAAGGLRIADQRVTLQKFQMNALGGQIGVTGYYETTDLTKPTFDVNLSLTSVDIPRAFQTLATVQALAPAARYATGTVTSSLHLGGTLGQNMLPVIPGLVGAGTLQTSPLVMRDFPPLQKAAEVTRLAFLDNPTLQALNASFEIHNGRLFMKPFDARVAGVGMKVAGSNGFDQSLQYTLDLSVPRSLLGGAANSALAGVMSRARQAGVDVATTSALPLAIRIGGTITSPTVSADLGTVASSAVKSATQAATQAVTDAAKQKTSAEAARLVQSAEQQAARIRADAQTLADKVKEEGYKQADSLTARAGGNPLAQVAAKAAADKLRQQADEKAASIVRIAGERADSVVAAARRQAEKVGGGA
ncbi:MAG TPA: AsmA-like C-terminal region-containing protein [Gemmatimonadaceae bacterium]|nr:AsmA-like C-terminal region-containing protein [Gemmatimonadaceae bacterium]